MYFAVTITHMSYLKALTFAMFSVMAGAVALVPVGLLYLSVLEPLVFCIRGALISLSVLLDQCVPKGQKASQFSCSEGHDVVTL